MKGIDLKYLSLMVRVLQRMIRIQFIKQDLILTLKDKSKILIGQEKTYYKRHSKQGLIGKLWSYLQNLLESELDFLI